MKTNVEFHLEDMVKRPVYSGRITIGADYARNNVRAVVLEVFEEDGSREQLVDDLTKSDGGKMAATIDVDDIISRRAGQQGRLTVGNEFSDREVRVAILGVADADREAAERVIERLEEAGEHEAVETVADVFDVSTAE